MTATEAPASLTRLTELFEAARATPGAPYEAERFLAYLTDPPAPQGRAVEDSFGGRRRFVRFMESLQLEFRICLTREDWDRGWTRDDLAAAVDTKIARPDLALTLARKRQREVRADLFVAPIKFGGLALPLLGAGVLLSQPVIKTLCLVLWVAVPVAVFLMGLNEYRDAQRLVASIEESA